jgi:hypothetical protein
MVTFTRPDLEQLREDCWHTHAAINQRALDLRSDGTLDSPTFMVIQNELQILAIQIGRLNTLIFLYAVDAISLREDSPGARIAEATNKLEAAAAHLEELHQTLLAFAGVIDALTSVITEILRRYPLPVG